MSDALASENTLAMSVANTGFMLDRLGQDCAPLQFLRELTQNSLEAIECLPDKSGTITWDVDWNQHTLTGQYKLSVIDDGIGMTGEEMMDYINQLSYSSRIQSHDGNFGVGAKIAAATRNHAGLLYLSWKDGRGSMVHLWRDPGTGVYGLRQFQLPDGTYDHWLPITDDVKPPQIGEHGTMVVLLGNEDDANTMTAPAGASSPSRWITYYLNTRYFRFPDGITVKAREGWEQPISNKDSNILRTLTGQADYLRKHALHQGTVGLDGANARWWILKEEPALGSNSGILASSGHMAALYQDELYEIATGRGGTARLQNFGVIFGYNRVVIYVEPTANGGRRLSSNTARTNLLIGGEPLPWVDWAAEFRSKMPPEIATLMEEVTSGTQELDHRQSILDRLREIRDLFRLSRYKPHSRGREMVDAADLVVGSSPRTERESGSGGRGGRGGGGGGQAGNVYALFASDEGTPAREIVGLTDPEVKWVSADEGTRVPPDLEDRAARYLHDQNKLLINGDFRVFTDFEERWLRKYSDIPGARATVRSTVHEWFEQALIETVIGTRALKGSREWDIEDLGVSLSEEALTAAVMPRYHIEQAVKRGLGSRLGSLKERATA